MALSQERDQLEGELSRMPEGSGRTLEQRRKKANAEKRLEEVLKASERGEASAQSRQQKLGARRVRRKRSRFFTIDSTVATPHTSSTTHEDYSEYIYTYLKLRYFMIMTAYRVSLRARRRRFDTVFGFRRRRAPAGGAARRRRPPPGPRRLRCRCSRSPPSRPPSRATRRCPARATAGSRFRARRLKKRRLAGSSRAIVSSVARPFVVVSPVSPEAAFRRAAAAAPLALFPRNAPTAARTSSTLAAPSITPSTVFGNARSSVSSEPRRARPA